MKIAIVSPGYMPVPATLGGAVEKLMTILMDENEKTGTFDFTVYTIFHESKSSHYQYSQIISYKKRIYHKIFYKLVNWTMKERRIFYNDKVVLSLEEQEEKFDYIVIENNIDLLLQILKRMKPDIAGKLIYHFHNDVNTLEYSQDKFQYLCKYGIPVITVSDYVKRHLLSIFPQMKMYVLKNVIDFQQFSVKKYCREEIRNLYQIEDDVQVIMFSGRIVEYKGILELLYAYQKILERGYTNTCLMIVGSYNNKKNAKDEFTLALEKKAEKCKEKVIFTGFVNHQEIQKYYAAADVVVIPSKVNEAAGLVALEAQAMKKPVIAANVGGISEYESEGSCCLVHQDNYFVENMADKLQELLIDKKYAFNIIEKGFKNVQKFNSQFYIANFWKIVSDIDSRKEDLDEGRHSDFS